MSDRSVTDLLTEVNILRETVRDAGDKLRKAERAAAKQRELDIYVFSEGYRKGAIAGATAVLDALRGNTQ